MDEDIYPDGSRLKCEPQIGLVGYLSWDDLKENLKKKKKKEAPGFQSGYIFQSYVSELFMACTLQY